MLTPRVALKYALKVRFLAVMCLPIESSRTGQTHKYPAATARMHAARCYCCTLLSCIWHLTLEWRSTQSIRGSLCGNMLIEAATRQLLLLLLGNRTTATPFWRTLHPRELFQRTTALWFLICAFDFIWVDNRIMMLNVFGKDFSRCSATDFRGTRILRRFFMASVVAHLLRTRFGSVNPTVN